MHLLLRAVFAGIGQPNGKTTVLPFQARLGQHGGMFFGHAGGEARAREAHLRFHLAAGQGLAQAQAQRRAQVARPLVAQGEVAAPAQHGRAVQAA